MILSKSPMIASSVRFKPQLAHGHPHLTARLLRSSTRPRRPLRRSSPAGSRTKIRTKTLTLRSISMWMMDPHLSRACRAILVHSPISPASHMNLWNACHPAHLQTMLLRNHSSARLLARAVLASLVPGKTARGSSPRRASPLKVTLKRTRSTKPNWGRALTAPSPVRRPQIVRHGAAWDFSLASRANPTRRARRVRELVKLGMMIFPSLRSLIHDISPVPSHPSGSWGSSRPDGFVWSTLDSEYYSLGDSIRYMYILPALLNSINPVNPSCC